MTRSVFARFAILACLAVIDVGRAIVLSIERTIDFVLSSIASPAKLLLSFDGPALALSGDGSPIDPALQHGLRHEAGLWRRSANRHI